PCVYSDRRGEGKNDRGLQTGRRPRDSRYSRTVRLGPPTTRGNSPAGAGSREFDSRSPQSQSRTVQAWSLAALLVSPLSASPSLRRSPLQAGSVDCYEAPQGRVTEWRAYRRLTWQ